jgi:hypothetical protein
MARSQVRTTQFFRSLGAGAAASLAVLFAPAVVPEAGLGAQLAQEVRDFHQGMRFGIGYAAVYPDAALGASAFMNFPARRFGLFADVKMTPGTVQDEPSFCPPPTRPPNLDRCTVETVQFEWPVDFQLRDVNEFLIFNAGGFYSITDEFAILLGAGWVRRHDFREFTEMVPDDEDWRVSDTGAYYAPFTEEGVWGAQGVLGLMFRAGNNLVFRFGVDTEPSGFAVGIYWAF